jgi:F-type H+-transporting ATPase subunit epsilon
MISLEIVTPEKIALSTTATMVVLPASDGQIGVLEGHAPLITALDAGEVTLYDGNTPQKTLHIGGGFADVTPERCVILAETVTDA